MNDRIIYCFGRDFPDKIVMSFFYSDGMTFKETIDYYTMLEEKWSNIYRVINEYNIMDIDTIFIFEKDDDYNFEEMLLNYKELIKTRIQFPVYILKDGKWFQTSPDFVLIPYEN